MKSCNKHIKIFSSDYSFKNNSWVKILNSFDYIQIIINVKSYIVYPDEQIVFIFERSNGNRQMLSNKIFKISFNILYLRLVLQKMF